MWIGTIVIGEKSLQLKPYKEPSLIIIQGSVKAFIPPVMPKTYVVADLIEKEDIIPDSLINCLIKYESGGNQNAIGKFGEIGWLQFMPSTWSDFNKRYNWDLDIYNSDHQILLAEKMIADGYLNRWTTAKFCK